MSAPNACVNRFGGLAAGMEEEQKRYFHEKRLYALQVESTDACRQECLYCYSGSTPTEHSGLTSLKSEICSTMRRAWRSARSTGWVAIRSSGTTGTSSCSTHEREVC